MKHTKKKGFTLIELLAVIVVLAVVLVLAVPIVLNNMNKAKKKSFQLYGERVLGSVMSAYESDRLLGGTSEKKYTDSTLGKTLPCYSLQDLKLDTTGSYRGFVTVDHSDEGNITIYRLYMTDSTYGYNGNTSDDVYNHPENITISGIDAIHAIVGKDEKETDSKCVKP